MDGFISGALFAVARKCEQLADELDLLEGELPDDLRADDARALAKRQSMRMRSEAKVAERHARGVLEISPTQIDDAGFIRRREISRYRRCVDCGRFAEYHVVPFLRGFDEKAMELTDLCKQIAESVNWPHGGSPLVARGANSYFFFAADIEEELIFAPALAGSTLLPLPDLVHEMAHSLVRNGERRQTILGKWCDEEHVKRQVMEAVGESAFGRVTARHWVDHGVEEIACDVIAAWVTGPAYAWQHVRACWGQREGESVYDEGDYHPPEHARFQVIMRTLANVGGRDEIEALQETWALVVGESPVQHSDPDDESITPLYPPHLVHQLADDVIRGCQRVGIKPFTDDLPLDDPRRIFSDAWKQMREEPAAFHLRERQQ